MESKTFIPYDFELPEDLITKIKAKTPNFGNDGLGELVYYRTYSRKKEDGTNESWHDTVLRVTKGIFSILKSHLITHHLPWDEEHWKKYSYGLAESIFDLEWTPPGRGLWAMGTTHIKEYGSTALNNCGFVSTEDLVSSVSWAMLCLVLGTGVGFNTEWKGDVSIPNQKNKEKFIVPDTREGWVDSVTQLLKKYITPVSGYYVYNDNHDLEFDYSQVRPAGLPLKIFGGISSGPEPLMQLHKRIKTYCYCLAIKNIMDTPVYEELKKTAINDLEGLGLEYVDYFIKAHPKYARVRLVCDIFNSVGAAVCSGASRRSSLIALGRPNDKDFIELKNLDVNPERADIYYSSNNTVQFSEVEEFGKYIPDVAKELIASKKGEPGIYNALNVKRFGRVNKYRDVTDEYTRELEQDKAIGVNPCGELPLESRELCNLAEVFPSRCVDTNGVFSEEIFHKTLSYATFYSSVVSLLPTISPETNQILARNRRIGISLSGTVLVSEKYGYTFMTELLKKAYRKVRETNNWIMDLCGVPRSIRVTTIKPSGSVSHLAGVPPGIHFPIVSRYVIRRVRIMEKDDLAAYLIKRGIPHEKDVYAKNTLCFEFPLDQGDVRCIKDVSMYEQLMVSVLYQSRYSDNSVSVTINYSDEEAKYLEEAIALNIPNVKTLSFAPKSEFRYEQAPYEAITEEKYHELKAKMGKLDFTEFRQSKSKDTDVPKFCDGESCTL